MQHYKNAGNSGVQSFETGDNFIIIEFEDSTSYLYNYERPGKHHVQLMIKLAENGKGLATYINQHVRDKYFKKL